MPTESVAEQYKDLFEGTERLKGTFILRIDFI
jgi:hypothetical protein